MKRFYLVFGLFFSPLFTLSAMDGNPEKGPTKKEVAALLLTRARSDSDLRANGNKEKVSVRKRSISPATDKRVDFLVLGQSAKFSPRRGCPQGINTKEATAESLISADEGAAADTE